MSYFAWNDSLKIYNSALDDDHRRLIQLLDDLHTASEQGRSKELLGSVLNALIMYAREHFQREEAFMKQIHYADFEPHKVEHEKFLLSVVDLRKRFDSNEPVLTQKVLTFLFDWLFHHIMTVDKKLAQKLTV